MPGDSRDSRSGWRATSSTCSATGRGCSPNDESATLYVREPLASDRVPDGPFATARPAPEAHGLLWENVRLAPAIRDVDVFFGPSYSLPLPYRGTTVVMIHSVNEVQEGTHPWWYPLHVHEHLSGERAQGRPRDRAVPVGEG